MRAKVIGVSIAVAIFLLGVGYGSWRFGSVENGLGYLEGRVVHLNQPKFDLGKVGTDATIEVSAEVTNMSNEDVEIAGAQCSCSCILPKNLPLKVPARSTVPVKLTLTAPAEPMDFTEDVEVYLNGPYASLHVVIVGTTR